MAAHWVTRRMKAIIVRAARFMAIFIGILAGVLTGAFTAGPSRAHADGWTFRTPCSSDQQHVYYEETPYPKMMAATTFSTFATTTLAWVTPNSNGNQNPSWLLAYLFAGSIGALAGPSCHDVPGEYVDGIAIAEEKSALPLDPSTHWRMTRKTIAVHAVNLLILTGVYVDARESSVKWAVFASAISPLIGYGLHEWKATRLRSQRSREAQMLEPRPESTSLRLVGGWLPASIGRGPLEDGLTPWIGLRFEWD